MMHKNYISWLDVTKGLGIILVIMGHCIFPCHQLIDIFHMPLFFFIAGFTIHKQEASRFILSKINRIGIPFVFWSVASACLALIPHFYFGPFNAPLWFLQTIFSALVIMYLVDLSPNSIQILITMCLCYLFYLITNGYIDNFLPFSLDRAIGGYLYLFLGFKLKDIFLNKNSKRVSILIEFFSLVWFIALFAYLFMYKGFSGNFVTLSMFESSFIIVSVCSLSGIMAVVYLAKIINRNKFLEYCGKNSLLVMCIHFPFAQLANIAISKLPFYNIIPFRIGCAILEYMLILSISLVISYYCKKYIPKLTGYSSLIKV